MDSVLNVSRVYIRRFLMANMAGRYCPDPDDPSYNVFLSNVLAYLAINETNEAIRIVSQILGTLIDHHQNNHDRKPVYMQPNDGNTQSGAGGSQSDDFDQPAMDGDEFDFPSEPTGGFGDASGEKSGSGGKSHSKRPRSDDPSDDDDEDEQSSKRVV